MIFKINPKELEKVSRQIINNIGYELEAEMRDEFNGLKSYYGNGRMSDTIIFDETGKVIGSEEWGVAASDTGQDWNWSKLPPVNKIAEWVRTDKDGGVYANASDRVVNAIAYKVALKIKNEGIESSFWMDDILLSYVVEVGANGSGRE